MEESIKLLENKLKEYENIIEELKKIHASDNAISSVIQDYHMVCEIKHELSNLKTN